MLTLWALVVMLAVYTGAFDLLTPPLQLRKLPDLNATLPSQIEKMLMCAELDLAGVLGNVISTVSSSNLLSVLDLTSLNILGGAGLGGVLGKGSGGKSSNLPLPLLSEATGVVGGLVPLAQETLGSLLPLGAEKNPVKGLVGSLLPLGAEKNPVKGLVGSLLPLGAEKNPVKGPVNDIGLSNLLPAVGDDRVDKLKESAQGVLNSAVPAGITNGLTGLLGNIGLEDLLIGLEVQKAAVESMTTTTTGDGILIDATTTAFIGGKGLAGPIVNILGFQVHSDMTLKIGISTNNTQCVNLQVQEKGIKVKKVSLQLVEMITESLPVPLPLDDIIPQVLTATINENIKESKSCDIDLSDFNECKNSTGLFKYRVKSYGLSAEGLSILYCGEALFNSNPVPVPGSPLPADPKNANVSLSLSHTLLSTIIVQSAKRSSVKGNNLDASIYKISYSFQPDNRMQVIYWVPVKKNGDSFATGKTTLIISHACKISKDKLRADIQAVSIQHSVIPLKAKVEVQDVMTAVLKKFLSAFVENLSQWNVPPGVTSNPLINAKVEVLKSTDLQAAN
ncbi:vomeromodulin-like [Diceros bicornis minor]|uniref:vomeromodulin-like n=1 Tax=Diceros bicornis minor TaxID=77932 RepID=UPI0026F18394|nr:vomeromodulin-like [Diceros bicornis minor]